MAQGTKDSTGTIASPSLPLDLVEEEILCRLPVKTLLQLRCICKSWKSLISDDPKFAKKHLRMSKILKQQQHLIVNVLYGNLFSFDYLLSDVFSNISNATVAHTQLNIPISNSIFSRNISEICSCDGILCLTLDDRRSAILCNPSLRKYSTLPPLEIHRKRDYDYQREVKPSLFSFGYDHVNDVYKVIAISCFKDKYEEVDVYTLGTNYWRSIQDFPYSRLSMYDPGVFVGGAVNWLASEEVSNSSDCHDIVSLDLEKESYQKISPPDLEKDGFWDLAMVRDCLCIFARSDFFDQNIGCYKFCLDVWIMKEYGIKESWTKLYHFPYLGYQYPYLKTVYISDDDQLLFSFDNNDQLKWAVYNSKNGNVKIPKIQHGNYWMHPEVYVESLISLPCSY
ncbi:hypothetical protein TSUD_303900 [Trifolium subterraneum]|uniref:F-box domain-containing protein n=1 Tax=Trifolium subterraneum TaxID=3900 RepID=A0A2Z6MMV5_TRISU|nr:hypothetical protein TSUD_303900 [Trifolium subterraneum]